MDFLNSPRDATMTGGKIEQRGAGERTLCDDYNNKSGSWYVPELGRATAAGMKLLGELPLDELDADLNEQIVQVGFSAAGKEPRPLLLVKQSITSGG